MPMQDLAFPKAKPRNHRKVIPIENNKHVNRWIHYFSNRNRDRFERFMDRGRYVKTKIQEILVANGVPPEMYYLAMIESGFASHARSHASAVGVWQFIAPTARRFGLRVDSYVDERLDMIKATHAASRYLKALHREFGDWYLAMAAYNAGENRIRRAVARSGSRNYWTLVRRGFLPRETAEYVAKFQAAMTISRFPWNYEFQALTLYDYPKIQKIKVRGRYVQLDRLADRHGISPKTLRALNPHLVRGVIPPGINSVYAPVL